MIQQLRAHWSRLSVRLTLAFLFVSIIPLVLVGGYGLQVSTRTLQEQTVQSEMLRLEDVVFSIELFFNAATEDARFLARSFPVQAYLSAERANDRAAMGRIEEAVRQDLAALAQARNVYSQIQLVNLQGDVMITVGTEKAPSAEPGRALPDPELQSAIAKGLTLAEGDIYITRLRLRRQDGAPLVPYVPTLRYIVPVFANGERIGLVMTTVDARPLFEHLATMATPKIPAVDEHEAGLLLLVDEQGFYLWHPNPQKRWGAPWDLNTGEQFGRDYPEMAHIVGSKEAGTIQTKQWLVTYMPVIPAPEYRWTLVEVVPLQAVLAPVQQFRNWFSPLIVLALGLSLGLGAVIARSVARPISALSRLTTRMESGDLRATEMIHATGEVGVLARAFHHMQDELRGVIQRIARATQQTHDAAETLSSMSAQLRLSAEQIASAVQQVAQGAGVQATQIDNISRAIQQLARATDQIATNAAHTQDTSDQASHKANRLVEALDDLQRRSDDIQTMAQTVKRFADQTNLLALNAAIEAARAGEHGKSFAVVADEVRRLAENSRQAVEDISAINAQVQATVQNVATAVQEIANIVHETAERARQTAEATAQQRQETETVAQAVNEIAALAEEQAASTEEMATAVEEQMVSTEELAAAAQNLSRLASELEELVAKFQVT